MGNTVAIPSTQQTHGTATRALELLAQEAKHYELLTHTTSTSQHCGRVFHTAPAYSLNEHRLPVVLKIYLKPDFFTNSLGGGSDVSNNTNSGDLNTPGMDRSSGRKSQEQNRIDTCIDTLHHLNLATAKMRFSIAPTQIYKETNQYLITVRQYFQHTLLDRLSAQPQLSFSEKKWLSFQILHLFGHLHKIGIAHGDVKPANVMTTSFAWCFITDFALHKPVFINYHDPSQYYYYFQNSIHKNYNNDACYLAPERFFIYDVYELDVITRRDIPYSTTLVPIVVYNDENEDIIPQDSEKSQNSDFLSQNAIFDREILYIEEICITKTPLYHLLTHMAHGSASKQGGAVVGGTSVYPNIIDTGMEDYSALLQAANNIKIAEIQKNLTQTPSNLPGQNRKIPPPLAPPQREQPTISPAMDVFSVGCLLYFIFTGDHLFTFTSLLAYVSKSENSFPSDKLSLRNIPNLTVLTIITHMVSWDPSQRLQLSEYLSILTSKLEFFPQWYPVLRTFWTKLLIHNDYCLTDVKANVLRKALPSLLQSLTEKSFSKNDTKFTKTEKKQSFDKVDAPTMTNISTAYTAPTSIIAKERLKQQISKPFYEHRKDAKIAISSRISENSQFNQLLGPEVSINSQITPETAQIQEDQIKSQSPTDLPKRLVSKHQALVNQLIHNDYHFYITSQLQTSQDTSTTAQIKAQLAKFTASVVPSIQHTMQKNPNSLWYEIDGQDNPYYLLIIPLLSLIQHVSTTNASTLIEMINMLLIRLIFSIKQKYLFKTSELKQIRAKIEAMQQTQKLSPQNPPKFTQYLNHIVTKHLIFLRLHQTYVKNIQLYHILPYYVSLLQSSLNYYNPILSTTMIRLQADLSILTHPFYNFNLKNQQFITESRSYTEFPHLFVESDEIRPKSTPGYSDVTAHGVNPLEAVSNYLYVKNDGHDIESHKTPRDPHVAQTPLVTPGLASPLMGSLPGSNPSITFSLNPLYSSQQTPIVSHASPSLSTKSPQPFSFFNGNNTIFSGHNSLASPRIMSFFGRKTIGGPILSPEQHRQRVCADYVNSILKSALNGKTKFEVWTMMNLHLNKLLRNFTLNSDKEGIEKSTTPSIDIYKLHELITAQHGITGVSHSLLPNLLPFPPTCANSGVDVNATRSQQQQQTVLYHRPMYTPVTPFSAPLVLLLLNSINSVVTTLLDDNMEYLEYVNALFMHLYPHFNESEEKSEKMENVKKNAVFSLLSLYHNAHIIQPLDYHLIRSIVVPMFVISAQHHSLPVVTTTVQILPQLIIKLVEMVDFLYNVNNTPKLINYALNHRDINELNGNIDTSTKFGELLKDYLADSPYSDLTAADNSQKTLKDMTKTPSARKIVDYLQKLREAVKKDGEDNQSDDAAQFSREDFALQPGDITETTYKIDQALRELIFPFSSTSTTLPQHLHKNENIKIITTLQKIILQQFITLYTTSASSISIQSSIYHVLLQQTPVITRIINTTLLENTLFPHVLSIFNAQSSFASKAILFTYIHYYFSVFSITNLPPLEHVEKNDQTFDFETNSGQNMQQFASIMQLDQSQRERLVLIMQSNKRAALQQHQQTQKQHIVVHVNKLHLFLTLLAPCYDQALYDHSANVVFSALVSFYNIVKLYYLYNLQHFSGNTFHEKYDFFSNFKMLEIIFELLRKATIHLLSPHKVLRNVVMLLISTMMACPYPQPSILNTEMLSEDLQLSPKSPLLHDIIYNEYIKDNKRRALYKFYDDLSTKPGDLAHTSLKAYTFVQLYKSIELLLSPQYLYHKSPEVALFFDELYGNQNPSIHKNDHSIPPNTCKSPKQYAKYAIHAQKTQKIMNKELLFTIFSSPQNFQTLLPHYIIPPIDHTTLRLLISQQNSITADNQVHFVEFYKFNPLSINLSQYLYENEHKLSQLNEDHVELTALREFLAQPGANDISQTMTLTERKQRARTAMKQKSVSLNSVDVSSLIDRFQGHVASPRVKIQVNNIISEESSDSEDEQDENENEKDNNNRLDIEKNSNRFKLYTIIQQWSNTMNNTYHTEQHQLSQQPTLFKQFLYDQTLHMHKTTIQTQYHVLQRVSNQINQQKQLYDAIIKQTQELQLQKQEHIKMVMEQQTRRILEAAQTNESLLNALNAQQQALTNAIGAAGFGVALAAQGTTDQIPRVVNNVTGAPGNQTTLQPTRDNNSNRNLPKTITSPPTVPTINDPTLLNNNMLAVGIILPQNINSPHNTMTSTAQIESIAMNTGTFNPGDDNLKFFTDQIPDVNVLFGSQNGVTGTTGVGSSSIPPPGTGLTGSKDPFSPHASLVTVLQTIPQPIQQQQVLHQQYLNIIKQQQQAQWVIQQQQQMLLRKEFSSNGTESASQVDLSATNSSIYMPMQIHPTLYVPLSKHSDIRTVHNEMETMLSSNHQLNPKKQGYKASLLPNNPGQSADITPSFQPNHNSTNNIINQDFVELDQATECVNPLHLQHQLAALLSLPTTSTSPFDQSNAIVRELINIHRGLLKAAQGSGSNNALLQQNQSSAVAQVLSQLQMTAQQSLSLNQLLLYSYCSHILYPQQSLRLFDVLNAPTNTTAFALPHHHHQQSIISAPNTTINPSTAGFNLAENSALMQLQKMSMMQFLDSTQIHSGSSTFATRSIPPQLLLLLHWYFHYIFIYNSHKETFNKHNTPSNFANFHQLPPHKKEEDVEELNDNQIFLKDDTTLPQFNSFSQFHLQTNEIVTQQTLSTINSFLLYLFYPKTHAVAKNPLFQLYLSNTVANANMNNQYQVPSQLANQASKIAMTMLHDLGASVDGANPNSGVNKHVVATLQQQTPGQTYNAAVAPGTGHNPAVAAALLSDYSLFEQNHIPPTVYLPAVTKGNNHTHIKSAPQPTAMNHPNGTSHIFGASTNNSSYLSPASPQSSADSNWFSPSTINKTALLINPITKQPISVSTTAVLQPIDIINVLLILITPPITATNSMGFNNTPNQLVDPLHNPKYLGHIMYFLLPLVNLWLNHTASSFCINNPQQISPPTFNYFTKASQTIQINQLLTNHVLSKKYQLKHVLGFLSNTHQIIRLSKAETGVSSGVYNKYDEDIVSHYLYSFNLLLSCYPPHVAQSLKIDQGSFGHSLQVQNYIAITRPQLLFYQQHYIYLNAHQRSHTLPLLIPACISSTNSPGAGAGQQQQQLQLQQHMQGVSVNNSSGSQLYNTVNMSKNNTIQQFSLCLDDHTKSITSAQTNHPVYYPYIPIQHVPRYLHDVESTIGSVPIEDLLASKRNGIVVIPSLSGNNDNGTNVLFASPSAGASPSSSSSQNPHISHQNNEIDNYHYNRVIIAKVSPSTIASCVQSHNCNMNLISHGITNPAIVPLPTQLPLPANTNANNLAKLHNIMQGSRGGRVLTDPMSMNPPSTSNTSFATVTAAQTSSTNQYSTIRGKRGREEVAANLANFVAGTAGGNGDFSTFSHQAAMGRYGTTGISSDGKTQKNAAPGNAGVVGGTQAGQVFTNHHNDKQWDALYPMQSHTQQPWYPKGRHQTTLGSHNDVITEMVVNDNNTLLATTSMDGNCRIFSTMQFNRTAGHTLPMATIHCHPNGDTPSNGGKNTSISAPPASTAVTTTAEFLANSDCLAVGASAIGSSSALLYDLNYITDSSCAAGSKIGSGNRTTVPSTAPAKDDNTANQSALTAKINVPGHIVSLQHVDTLSHSLLLATTHTGSTYGWDTRMNRPAFSLQQPAMPQGTSTLYPSLTTHATLGPNPYSYITGTNSGFLYIYDIRSQQYNNAITHVWQAPSATAITSLVCINNTTLFPPSKQQQFLHSIHSPLVCLSTLYSNEVAVYDLYTGECRSVLRSFDYTSSDGNEQQRKDETQSPLIALDYKKYAEFNGQIDLSYCYTSSSSSHGSNFIGFPFTLHNPLSVAYSYSSRADPYSTLTGYHTHHQQQLRENSGQPHTQANYEQNVLLQLYKNVNMLKHNAHGITSILPSTPTHINQVPFILTGGNDGIVRFWNLRQPSSSYHVISPYYLHGNGYYHYNAHLYTQQQQQQSAQQQQGVTSNNPSSSMLSHQNNTATLTSLQQYQQQLQLYYYTQIHPNVNVVNVPKYNANNLHITVKQPTKQPTAADYITCNPGTNHITSSEHTTTIFCIEERKELFYRDSIQKTQQQLEQQLSQSAGAQQSAMFRALYPTYNQSVHSLNSTDAAGHFSNNFFTQYLPDHASHNDFARSHTTMTVQQKSQDQQQQHNWNSNRGISHLAFVDNIYNKFKYIISANNAGDVEVWY